MVAAVALKAGPVPDQAARAYWCALGNLYAAARTEVMRMGHAAALGPDLSQSTMLMNVRHSCPLVPLIACILPAGMLNWGGCVVHAPLVTLHEQNLALLLLVLLMLQAL